MRFWIHPVLLISLGVPSLPVLTQRESRSSQETKPPKFAVTANTVVLDLVVRDKKGRPVKDLSAPDFEIYEDNVRQQIESFQLITREAEISKPRGTEERSKRAEMTRPATARDPFAGVGFIALVFDRLSLEARNLAHKAALNYVAESIRPDDLVGVFAIDLSLHTLQQYTSNTQLVRQAIDAGASLATSGFPSSSERTRSLTERESSLQTQGALSAATAASGGSANAAQAQAAGGTTGQTAAEALLAQMETRMLETFESLERDQQGYATSDGLLAIVNSMRVLPGRKAILFFSEGLSIPPAVLSHFRSVINAANRANVSIYSMDAAGLRVESANEEARRNINSLGQRRSNQAASGRDDTSGAMLKQLERNEDLLRLSPHSGLGQLAEETGGFLIRETNDLGAGMRRIDEDLRVYYMLAYQPSNQDYNGRFRQISVKVKRPNLELQTRKGYYAVRDVISSPVLEYEAPALAALSGTAAPGGLDLRSLALNFPESKRPGLVPVLVEVPARLFTYSSDSSKQLYNADFTILALIRDASNQAVKKLSRHYVPTVPAEKLESAKQGDILFYKETELPPGHYKIEAVTYDALSGKSGQGFSSVDIPVTDGSKPRLSSIVLIKRAERVGSAQQNSAHPLHYGEVLIYPNLGEPVMKASNQQLAFFLTVYPSTNTPAPPKLRIELFRDARSVAVSSVDLPAPDSSGRIQYASTLPLDRFQPGDYELKITARDQHSSMTRVEHFTLQP